MRSWLDGKGRPDWSVTYYGCGCFRVVAEATAFYHDPHCLAHDPDGGLVERPERLVQNG